MPLSGKGSVKHAGRRIGHFVCVCVGLWDLCCAPPREYRTPLLRSLMLPAAPYPSTASLSSIAFARHCWPLGLFIQSEVPKQPVLPVLAVIGSVHILTVQLLNRPSFVRARRITTVLVWMTGTVFRVFGTSVILITVVQNFLAGTSANPGENGQRTHPVPMI